MDIGEIEENNKTEMNKKTLATGDMNVALDTNTIHIFDFDDTNKDTNDFKLLSICDHTKIKFTQIIELRAEKSPLSGFTFVSNTWNTLLL